ncbi:hypothetical protein [Mucilaginibacter agri]|uniref:Uncharacterized protein n=1 Tax=Mucilaginibacter agri TaxID=2695265 RepID=A0A965ZHP5_9SPHI|nr:hypothetical protein [Mucilaginibacter agri]NCD69932.1 hypothetical protein [Mucilaginibacter agri]
MKRIKIELFTGVFCSLFAMGLGVWLFNYVLNLNRNAEVSAFSSHATLYIMSFTCMIIGLGVLLVTEVPRERAS